MMTRWITAAVVLAAFFFGGWLLGRRTSRPEVVETVRIDTVFYERPQPVSVSDNVVTVDVPWMIFVDQRPSADSITNQDTIQVTNQVTNQGRDSVQMQVILRTLEYRDSTYYARVVGPVVGSLAPRLDYIETYNTTITRTETVERFNRFSLDATFGTEYAQSAWSPYAELAFTVNFKKFKVSATVGADNVFKNPIPRVGASFGIPIWSK